MPRYHFNVIDGQNLPDVTGTVLRDLDAARAEAVMLSGALLRDAGSDFWQGRLWKMVVTDEAGATLFVLQFTAMDVVPAAAAASPA